MFLLQEYHLSDIPFKELKRDFMDKFVVFMSNHLGLRSGSMQTSIKKLHLMTYTAFQNGWIAADPFAGFRFKAEYRDRRYLSETEMQAVMNVQVPNKYRTTKPR